MSCDYPVKCPYYKDGKCSIPPDKFQEMCEKEIILVNNTLLELNRNV